MGTSCCGVLRLPEGVDCSLSILGWLGGVAFQDFFNEILVITNRDYFLSLPIGVTG